MKLLICCLVFSIIALTLNSLAFESSITMARTRILRKRVNPRPDSSNRGKKSKQSRDSDSSSDDDSVKSIKPSTPPPRISIESSRESNVKNMVDSMSPGSLEALFAQIAKKQATEASSVDPPNDDSSLVEFDPSSLYYARESMIHQNEAMLENYGGGMDKNILTKAKLTPEYVRRQSKIMEVVRIHCLFRSFFHSFTHPFAVSRSYS